MEISQQERQLWAIAKSKGLSHAQQVAYVTRGLGYKPMSVRIEEMREKMRERRDLCRKTLRRS